MRAAWFGVLMTCGVSLVALMIYVSVHRVQATYFWTISGGGRLVASQATAPCKTMTPNATAATCHFYDLVVGHAPLRATAWSDQPFHWTKRFHDQRAADVFADDYHARTAFYPNAWLTSTITSHEDSLVIVHNVHKTATATHFFLETSNSENGNLARMADRDTPVVLVVDSFFDDVLDFFGACTNSCPTGQAGICDKDTGTWHCDHDVVPNANCKGSDACTTFIST